MWVFLFHGFLFHSPFNRDSAATTTASISTLMKTVNVSDTGAHVDFRVTKGPSTSTTSPLREDDSDIVFGDDQEAFQDFTFSPFTLHWNNDDDDAPMTQGKFKQPSAKLDSILESSVTSSNYEFMLKSHRSTVLRHTKENAKVLAESTKAIQASEQTIADATVKVEKLYAEVTQFMLGF